MSHRAGIIGGVEEDEQLAADARELDDAEIARAEALAEIQRRSEAMSASMRYWQS